MTSAAQILGERVQESGAIAERVGLPDFSLVAGGPLYRLFCRVHLADGSLGLLKRRLTVVLLMAWVPLLPLALLENGAWKNLSLSFLTDASIHLRLLVALPLMLAAEPVAHDWMRTLARRFVEREVVSPAGRPRFEAAVRTAHRLRDSLYPELLIIAVVWILGVAINLSRVRLLEEPTWYLRFRGGANEPSLAGWWAGLISLPLFQLFLLRWYWRWFIWAQFLWRVARVPLRLAATQPDCAGGLGFIGTATEGFWVLLVAHGAIGAAVLAHGISYGGVSVLQYELDVCVLWALVLFWVVAPLLVFAPTLQRTKRAGKSSYGALSQQYAFQFERQWMSGRATEERLLGSSDIQSLADLRNGYDVVKKMRLIPIGNDTLIRLMILPLIPIAPLALALVPIDKLVVRVISALF